MWDIDMEEALELWRDNRSDIMKWLESKAPRYSSVAHVLPNGKAFYHNDYSSEALDFTNYEAVEDHFRFLGIDLDRYVGDYDVELPTIFNISEEPEDLELGAICAFFWNLDDYLTRVHPLLNEDEYYTMLYEEQARRAEEDVEGFTSEEEWLSNYGHGHNLSYTGYGNDVGDLPSDYVQELAEDTGSTEWQDLAYQDRMIFYDYYGIDY